MPSSPALKHGGRQRNMDVRAQQIAAVVFVDWRTVAVGPWVHDVNYFLVFALDVPNRRVHECDLLATT